MTTRVTLIPGDGVGPEVTEATRRVLEATGASFEWDRQDMGAGAFSRTGRALPMATLDAIRASRVALKGPIETPVTSGLRSSNLALRRDLDLFANVRPCKRYPGVPSVYEQVDLVVIRENTEGMYTGIELERGTSAVSALIAFVGSTTGQTVRSDSGISVKEISASGAERIVRFAFEWARAHGRKRVTASHKANIMKYSDGLFLQVATEVAAAYPDLAFDDRIIDALCLQLIQAPERFDVLVLPNMYGDLVAELGAGLIGGTGVAPGAHFGGDGDRELAVFEATHGTANHLAGTNRADPIGLILSGAMLLHHIGETDAGDRVDAAVAAVLAEGVFVTYDLRAPGDDRPAAGTFGVADAVIARL
jgi:isocitrate dehydrogenase (NAD+)